jgi:hypothetical protein
MLRLAFFSAPDPANVWMLSRGAAPPSGSATRSVAQERGGWAAGPNERRYVGSCNELVGR